MATFGQSLKKIRTKRKMSLEEVGSEAQLSRTAVMRIEDGNREPKMNSLIGLAKALDVKITISPDGLFVEEVEREEALA